MCVLSGTLNPRSLLKNNKDQKCIHSGQPNQSGTQQLCSILVAVDYWQIPFLSFRFSPFKSYSEGKKQENIKFFHTKSFPHRFWVSLFPICNVNHWISSFWVLKLSFLFSFPISLSCGFDLWKLRSHISVVWGGYAHVCSVMSDSLWAHGL